MNKSEEFLRKINEAFMDGDKEYLLESVTADFCWNIVGEKLIGGKTEFTDALELMQEMPPLNIKVGKIIISENTGVVVGMVTGKNRLGQKKQYSFCDIYELEETPALKIKQMTSYVVDVSKYKQYKENC